jgi:hypothetical protein
VNQGLFEGRENHLSETALKLFPATLYSPSYVALHPAKFLNTDWVDIQELKEFLKDQSLAPQIPKSESESAVSTGGSSDLWCSLPPDATNPARVKPDPDACFLPDLSNPIKKELDVLDLSFDTSDTLRHVGTRQIQEGGKEVILILDSDSEGEESVALPRDGEDGMSSDTAVGDFSGFASDSEGDKSLIMTTAEVNCSDSDIDRMSDIEVDPEKTLWLDDGLISRVSNKPCKKVSGVGRISK